MISVRRQHPAAARVQADLKSPARLITQWTIGTGQSLAPIDKTGCSQRERGIFLQDSAKSENPPHASLKKGGALLRFYPNRVVLMFFAAAKKISLLLLLSAAVSAAAYADDNYLSVKVVDPFIELHTGPGRGYPIFYIAERGAIVEALKKRTDWIKVRINKGTPREKQGWVSIAQMARTLGPDGMPLALAYPDFDAYQKRKWEGGLMTGSFGGADIVSAYGAFQFTRNISIELEGSQYFGSFSNGEVLTASLVEQPFPQWRLSPFFTLGGGKIFTEPKSTLVQTQNRNDGLVDVGIGVRYYLTRRFLLRAQYKNYVVLTNQATNQNIEEWKIGFSVFF